MLVFKQTHMHPSCMLYIYERKAWFEARRICNTFHCLFCITFCWFSLYMYVHGVYRLCCIISPCQRWSWSLCLHSSREPRGDRQHSTKVARVCHQRRPQCQPLHRKEGKNGENESWWAVIKLKSNSSSTWISYLHAGPSKFVLLTGGVN